MYETVLTKIIRVLNHQDNHFLSDSTQVLMLSCSKNTVATFTTIGGNILKFEQCFCSKTDHLLINIVCRQDGRVWQFLPISGCIEDDLKFGAVILWTKDGREPRRHLHTWKVLKVVAVIVFRWNKIVNYTCIWFAHVERRDNNRI